MTNSERPPDDTEVARGTDVLYPSPHVQFAIPSCRSIFVSPAARWLARRTGDRLRAEFLVLLTVVGGVFFMLVAAHFFWVFYTDLPSFSPLSPVGLTVSTGVVLGAGLLSACFPGVQEEIRINFTRKGIRFSQGASQFVVSYSSVEEATRIDALLYHRHYRRFHRTRIFANRIGASVILIKTAADPVIVGLDGVEAAQFLDELSRVSGEVRV